MQFNRRDLIRGLTALAPFTVAGHLWAAPKTDAKLLVVFLRGAYDAANVIIPVSSDFYYASRPTLAIARPNPLVATSALSLDANWGLHPALKDTIFTLYQKGQAAFIPFAGTDDLTRSHFETQDTIELGQDVNGTRDYRSGFMARLASALTKARPIAFTDQMPLTFQGGEPVPNIAINSVGKPGVDARQAALIASMYDGKPLAASVREGFRVRDDVYQAITDHMVEASRGAVSPKGFELSARRIGRLMRCLLYTSRVGHVLRLHRRAQLPGDDIAREVIQDRAEIEPAPAGHLEIGEVGLPELVRCCRLVLELIGGLHDDEGRAGNQIMRLEQPVHRSLRHKIVSRIGEARGQLPWR